MVGLGASDMKGGLAVMVELARWVASLRTADTELAYDLGLLFFPREELGPSENPLPAVFERAPLIDEAKLVICLEPTDNTLQLGCLGNLNARVVFEGRSAHSARPWLGVNAIALAFDGLRQVLAAEPRDVEIERAGLPRGDLGDAAERGHRVERDPGPRRGDRQLSLRARPHTAERRGARARARRARGRDPLPRATRARRRELGARRRSFALPASFEVQPKQAWTNVADFAARGLDAVNLGPGGTRYAHAVDERVEIAELDADLRGPAAVPASVASRRCSSPPSSQNSPSIRSRASTTGRPRRRARGIELIDFGMGDPREVTPAFIREAMLASVDAVSSYPRATGLPELREAIAGWIGRRFGVHVDPATEIVPTLGSKEAIFSFPQVALGEKRLVAIPEPGYPVYERGTLFAGGSVATVALKESAGWLPDLDAVRRLGRDRGLLGLLPEQPDRRRRTALVLRGARGPGARSTAS